MKVIKGLLAAAVVGGLAWFYLGGGVELVASKNGQRVAEKVLKDATDQYEMAMKSGTALDACTHAGIAKEAALQAKDDAAFQRFSESEKEWCQIAAVLH